MTIYSDVLIKSMLIEWLAGVPDDAPIAIQLNEPLMLDFIVVSVTGQDRILRVGIFGPNDDDEQTDPETNEH